MNKISGTKEWASHNVNCVTGCLHDCKYCYARYDAVQRFDRVKIDEWKTMIVRERDVKKKRKKLDGTIMFPTTHDITPEVLKSCLDVVLKMLAADNNLLIVSKPHLECIKEICKQCEDYKKQILFRFTIGAMNNDILKFWEPGAPSFEERLESLKCAFNSGYSTSISVEPMLDSENVVTLFDTLKPFVTNSIWIGKMNKMNSRVQTDEKEKVYKIIDGQTDNKIFVIYNQLKNEPLVKWKESIKKVVGLDLLNEKGLDL